MSSCDDSAERVGATPAARGAQKKAVAEAADEEAPEHEGETLPDTKPRKGGRGRGRGLGRGRGKAKAKPKPQKIAKPKIAKPPKPKVVAASSAARDFWKRAWTNNITPTPTNTLG